MFPRFLFSLFIDLKSQDGEESAQFASTFMQLLFQPQMTEVSSKSFQK
jgi:hypothetical protein